jgi:hypothetical protein
MKKLLIPLAVLLISAFIFSSCFSGPTTSAPAATTPSVTTSATSTTWAATTQPITTTATTTATASTTPAATQPTPTPPFGQETFDFIFKYGYSPAMANELDTFKNTFTLDMVSELPVGTKLSLSQEDKEKIFQKMQDIDFFNYPDVYGRPIPSGYPLNPQLNRYYFYVKYGSQIKELRWDDNIIGLDSQASKLRILIQLIQSIIKSKEEYKNLPTPRSQYQ